MVAGILTSFLVEHCPKNSARSLDCNSNENVQTSYGGGVLRDMEIVQVSFMTNWDVDCRLTLVVEHSGILSRFQDNSIKCEKGNSYFPQAIFGMGPMSCGFALRLTSGRVYVCFDRID